MGKNELAAKRPETYFAIAFLFADYQYKCKRQLRVRHIHVCIWRPRYSFWRPKLTARRLKKIAVIFGEIYRTEFYLENR